MAAIGPVLAHESKGLLPLVHGESSLELPRGRGGAADGGAADGDAADGDAEFGVAIGGAFQVGVARDFRRLERIQTRSTSAPAMKIYLTM